MSCPEGFSVASSTDPTCVRDCALGPTDKYPQGAYYPSGELCWPTCPLLSTDLGSACSKTFLQRQPLNWQTNLNKDQDYKRRRNPSNIAEFWGNQVSNIAGCPPNHTAFLSSEEVYPNSNEPVIKCFYNCPNTGDSSLNEMGQCLVNICPLNEIGTNRFQKGVMTNGTYTDNSGNNFDVNSLTTVCNRGGATSANTTAYRVTRTHGVPSCPTGFKAEFFTENRYSSYVSVNNAQGISVSNANYEDYYTCTSQCNSDGSTTLKRYGQYCSPDCPDDGDFNFKVATLNQARGILYESLTSAKDTPPQSRCIKVLGPNGTGNLTSNPNVAPPDAPSQSGSCPSGLTAVRRWQLAVNSNPQVQTQWRTSDLGDPLYMINNTATTAYPTSTACTNVCPNPIGFLENPPNGDDRSVTIFCGKSPTPSNFTNDYIIANMWQRQMIFNDPRTTLASSCGNLSLMGTSNFVKDNTDAIGMGAGLGYAYEIPPQPFYRSAAFQAYTDISRNDDETYSPTYYEFGEIVGTYVDQISFLEDNGSPIVNPLIDTTDKTPNRRKGYVIGPFYRCILAHYAAPNSTLPPTTLTYPNGTWALPPGSAGTWTVDGFPRSVPMYLQDNTVSLINPSTYWEVTNISSLTVIDDIRTAGPISNPAITIFKNFQEQLCKPEVIVGGNVVAAEFCPPICLSRCPGSNMPPSNNDVYGQPPSQSYVYHSIGSSYARYDITPGNNLQSQAGMYEYFFDTPGGPQSDLTAVCYPRCGSSAQYLADSNFCITKSNPIENNVVPGYSWCPPAADIDGKTDPLSIGKSNYQNVVPTNPDTDHEANPEIIGVPSKNICLTPCSAGTIVNNNSPQDQCVTQCDLDGRFLDTGYNCLKIPYQRASANSSSVTSTTTLAEQAFAPTATTVSKFALAGGSQSLLISVSAIIAACLLISIILFVMQYQSGRLSLLH